MVSADSCYCLLISSSARGVVLVLQQPSLRKVINLASHVPFETIAAALSIVVLAWTVHSALWSKVRRWLDKRFLRKRLGAELFTPEEILSAIKLYVEPDCQNIDPSGGEEWRRTAAVRQNAFSTLDRLFSNSEYRHSILLADSGMGKTSLLLNYYARFRSWRGKKMAFAIVPLGYPRHDEVIKSIADNCR